MFRRLYERGLLTGGTGFLGTELAARLAKAEETLVYVLVRAADHAEAAQRLRAARQHDQSLYQAVGKQLLPLPGDFTKADLGLSAEALQALRDHVTLVIHAGAEIGFDKSKAELDQTNVIGTRNMIALAQSLPRLRRFLHISTAYVAGRKNGRVMEEELPGNRFSSLYEQSKAEAENLLRASGLPWSICRPGMIVGDSETGWVRNFNTVYYVLKQLLLGKIRLLPIREDTPLNLVPVDKVADAALTVARSDAAEGKTFHLTCPKDQAPTAGELCDAVIAWAQKHLSVRLKRPGFLPLSAFKKAGLAYNQKEDSRKKSSLNNLLMLLPYFYADQVFDRTNTDALCGPYKADWRKYLDTLLTFACRKNFMRQTGQTVFEQAMVRRASRRYPITYYNVTAEGIEAVQGPEVNARIEKIRNALWAWGIRKGDRVALTGINSVDYLALEQAIGLMGAVSVPIYYTTPAAEAETLLQKSGAHWFFVGDRRMLAQLEKMRTARIVLFSVVQKESLPSAMGWDQFLEKSQAPAPMQRPDPEDLATIRYTSGTTGEPKGVTLNFRQLSWMGEVLTNLVSWQDRHRPMRYLSFLPLSHVVEGILASYAPYYLLADMGYYYLNDFGVLTDALPKVRPTIFFSVPRFYEKLWEKAISNPVGKAWQKAPEGMYRQALGRLLKAVVLKKAGIDQCRQLIVGSAPVSEALLKNFRALGIDLDEQFAELSRELPITTGHQQHWTKTTWTMFHLFEQMGPDPVVTPKLMRAAKCAECGHCAIGCPTGAKWDTRALTKEAVQNGAVLITDCRVTDLDIENGQVKAVHARMHEKRETYQADLVVLSAGGLGTPVILQHSGVSCSDTLFADPVLCVAGPMEDFGQDHQLLMPFISQQDGYILSPYMDYLSFFFHRSWRLPMRNIASIMIKLADEEAGTTDGKRIRKTMSPADQRRMDRAVVQSREILERLGVRERDQFLGTLNAGHPGGMLPLTEREKDSLHPSVLPDNLYIADATILPRSMGNPPMLTIMALVKKIASLL